MKVETARPVSKVKGPIRCHKCRLNCRDAAHYLDHKCQPSSLEISLFPPLASQQRD